MSVFQAVMPTGSYPSLMSGWVVAGTPSYSSGRIGCWLYADYSRTASVTFSYKVGETVTEKFFMVKHNGEVVKGIKFNGVLLDPNQ